MASVETTGPTVDDAIDTALEKLDLDAFPEMARLVGAYCNWYRQSGIAGQGPDLAVSQSSSANQLNVFVDSLA